MGSGTPMIADSLFDKVDCSLCLTPIFLKSAALKVKFATGSLL
jgi:hypothetical protein